MVNAHLVNLPVVVRDKNGALVQNLTQADFALSVDGHPQTIRYFDKDNDLPLTLGLLIDTSGSVRSALDDERTASEAFLDQMMREGNGAGGAGQSGTSHAPDEAFLIQFAHEADLLQNSNKTSAALMDFISHRKRSQAGSPDKIRRSVWFSLPSAQGWTVFFPVCGVSIGFGKIVSFTCTAHKHSPHTPSTSARPLNTHTAPKMA